MKRVSDRGGWPGAGPIDRSAEPADWEVLVDALSTLLWAAKRYQVAEIRRVIESLSVAAYEAAGPYGQRVIGMEALLIEKGICTREELATTLAELAE